MMKSAKCRKCGFVGWADAEACKRCGEPMAPRSVAQPVEQPVANQTFAPPPDHQGPEQPGETQTYYYPAGTNPFPEDLKTGWAITALVFGIGNFMLFGILVIPIFVGIAISVVALKKINRDPFKYGGKGMAIAGLVTNLVSVVVLIPLLLIIAIAVPNLLAARRAANEGATINALRTIHSAQATYQATRGRGLYGSMSELRSENLIRTELANETYCGYRYKVETSRDTGDGLPGFTVVAVPIQYGSTGTRSFYLDETGVIRGGDMNGIEASKYDPPLRSDSEYSSSRPKRKSPFDE